MFKVPAEYKIAQEVVEELFSVYLPKFPAGHHLDQFTEDVLFRMVTGFVIGKGYDWDSIRFWYVQHLVYWMLQDSLSWGTTQENDCDYAWVVHVCKTLGPKYGKRTEGLR